jgi:KUP system potassium uptake protein
LEFETPIFKPYVVPITIVILIGLFLLQSRGTAKVGSIFGPITGLWFLTLALLGLSHLVKRPEVLAAINPYHAMQFFSENGWHGFRVLGTVFLVVTGGEALYADIGHFGTRPIRLVWFIVVFPALLLCYFGQGAYMLSNPDTIHPFYGMAPRWFIYPLVILATMATIVASQAVITGAFSLTLQAVQLGYSPRLRIDHTSSEQIGQIYVGVVNWALMLASIGLVLGFRSSSNLASAYGIAITMTMVITSILFFELLVRRWNWSLPAAILMAGGFLLIDTAFFLGNIVKVAQGGWFPLVVAGGIFLLMSTWSAGRALLRKRMREGMVSLDLFLADALNEHPQRVPGLAIFLFSNRVGTPPALRHNYVHNRVLHERTIIATVETAEHPRVAPEDRFEIEEVGEGFYHVVMTYGFMDTPNLPQDIRRLQIPGVEFDEADVSYFIGRETLLVTDTPGMPLWREWLFVWMSRNSQTANQYFHLPPDQVMEVGRQIAL